MKQIVKLLTLMCRKAHLPAFALMALLSGLSAHADVVINETTFPDANFRTFILQQDYGKDRVLTDAEIAKVTRIYCSSKNILSLKGIEFFSALQELTCTQNQLTSLDVSKNTALTSLSCSNNQLTTLDVSKNLALTGLGCQFNQLTSLDVSKNTALTSLTCYQNQLTALDVSKNPNLSGLLCSNNNLTVLDVSKNPMLKTLDCKFNQLTTLDLTKNTTLETLHCAGNQLTELDLTYNKVAFRYLFYATQVRTLTAESAVTPDGERFYYLRLDDNTDNDQPIWARMTETNFGGVESKFDPSRVLEWTFGGTVIEGQKRVATTANDLDPKNVKGKILLLTDVTEDANTNTASGTVKYKYNVNNSFDTDGSKGDFTLKWTAPMPEGATHGPSSLVLNDSLIRLQITQSYQLKVETPNAGEITWTSSNPEVVQVDSTGRITAIKNGTAIITATTAKGLSNWCGVWSYLRGDLNEDEKVDIADLNEEINLILTQ